LPAPFPVNCEFLYKYKGITAIAATLNCLDKRIASFPAITACLAKTSPKPRQKNRTGFHRSVPLRIASNPPANCLQKKGDPANTAHTSLLPISDIKYQIPDTKNPRSSAEPSAARFRKSS